MAFGQMIVVSCLTLNKDQKVHGACERSAKNGDDLTISKPGKVNINGLQPPPGELLDFKSCESSRELSSIKIAGLTACLCTDFSPSAVAVGL